MAPKAGSQPITEETVREWLTAARAVEPWDFESIAMTVRNLEALRLQTPHIDRRRGEKPSGPLHRARRAINELRSTLPEVAALLDTEIQSSVRLGHASEGKSYKAYAEHIKALQVALSAELLPEPSNPKTFLRADRNAANTAYQCFTYIVAKGSISRNSSNPALIFVSKALEATGCRKPKEATLEGWLLSDQNEYPQQR